MGIGYIKLHRQLQDCWVWMDEKDPEPFSRGQAWVDLLMLANHADKKTRVDNRIVTIQRGQKLTSIRKLAERWKWSRKKVSNFLDLLESDDMISQERATKYTLITIVNYTVYQCFDGEKEPPKSHPRATQEPQESHTRATGEPQRNTNNNDNNDKNDKNIYIGRFKKPTIEEIKAYCEERNNNIDAEQFFNYYESNGWRVGKNPMKSWQACVRTWEKNGYSKKKEDNELDLIEQKALRG